MINREELPHVQMVRIPAPRVEARPEQLALTIREPGLVRSDYYSRGSESSIRSFFGRPIGKKSMIAASILAAIILLQFIPIEPAQRAVSTIKQTLDQPGNWEETIGKLHLVDNADSRISEVFSEGGLNFAVPVQGSVIGRFSGGEHERLDIRCGKSELVFATLKGTVTEINPQAEEGALVRVDHGNGLESVYTGVERVQVSLGQQVDAQEVLACAGPREDGYGLGYALMMQGKAVDPLPYLLNES